jgi:hypothetical protein
MPDTSPPLPGPFLRTDAQSLGVTERRLKSPAYRTVFTGVVVDARIPDTVVVRSRAAMLVCPEGGVISHWTAARLWGGVVPDNEWTHVSFMRDVRLRLGGVKPHRFRHRLDIKRRHGLPVTSPGQTFCHLAKHLGLVDLVALGDRLVKKGRLTPAELIDYADSWQGQCREDARRAAQLVRDGVDSVPETALRLLMVLAGLPEPTVNIRIRDADGHVRFRIELGDEGARLAIEYDGRWHDAPEQKEHDEARRSGLRSTDGWTFVIVKAEELYDFPETLLERIRDEMRSLGIEVPAVLSDDWRRHFRVMTAAA